MGIAMKPPHPPNLRRISVDLLEPGMYIHEVCAPWTQHPFWRSAFMLSDPSDVARMREHDIAEVWIDCSRGKDVTASDQADAERSFPEEVLGGSAEAPAVVRVQAAKMGDELDQAALICSRAKNAVISMFGEVRMGKAVDTGAASALVTEISDSVLRHRSALISLVRLRSQDEYSYMHSVAVCALMIALARELGMSEDDVHRAGRAGLLHDLGKALMPLEVLNKPGTLTDAEFDIMRGHPKGGHRLLAEAGETDEIVLDVCLHHHEKLNGCGYPERLGGDTISLFARMGAVCDVYDAITSNRPYKAGWDPGESIRRMADWCTTHFDERIFHAFVRCLGIYPTGSLVRLASGRLGIVVEQGAGSLTAPRVRVFYSTRSNARIRPETVDLGLRNCPDRVVGSESPDKWHFPDLDLLWQEAARTAP